MAAIAKAVRDLFNRCPVCGTKPKPKPQRKGLVKAIDIATKYVPPISVIRALVAQLIYEATGRCIECGMKDERGALLSIIDLWPLIIMIATAVMMSLLAGSGLLG